MANPTIAEIWAQHLNKVKILDQLSTNAGALFTLLNTYEESSETDYTTENQSYIDNLRSVNAGFFQQGKDFLWNTWQDLRKYMNVQFSDSNLYQSIFEYMNTNLIYFRSRGLTTSIAQIATKGTLKICTKDRFAYNIESLDPGVFNFKCIGDVNLGDTSGHETFYFSGPFSGNNFYERLSTAYIDDGEVNAEVANDHSYLKNNSFEQNVEPTAPATKVSLTVAADLPEWTVSTGVVTNLKTCNNRYFRIDTNQYSTTYGLSLAIEGNRAGGLGGTIEIEQAIQNSIDRFTPYYPIVRYYSEAGNLGILTLTLGSKNVTATLTGDATWHELTFSGDEKFWYDYFMPATNTDLILKIKWTQDNASTADLIIDEVFFAPFKNFKDTDYWYLITAGSLDFVLGENIALTISYSTTVKRQYWHAILEGKYYPHATAAYLSET